MGVEEKQGTAFVNAEYLADDIYSYHLILLSDAEEMYNLWLPQTPEGFFRFSENREHRFLSISAKNGKWIASCKKPAFFQNVPLEQSCETVLEDGQLLKVDFDEISYSIYVEKISRKNKTFHNYFVPANLEVTIGSHPGCDIYYDNPLVSRNHAVLSRVNGQWQIRDCGSIYGTYVNGIKKRNCRLNLGDVIYIIGLRIVVGAGFFAVSDGAGKINTCETRLQSMPMGHSGYSHYDTEDRFGIVDEYFNRAPRKRFEISSEPIVVEGPPMSMDLKQMPLLLRMGSSMVMGGAAALAGNFTTLISSVAFPFLSSKFTEKQKQEYEQLRKTKYTEYLEEKRIEIAEACKREQDYLNQKYPVLRDVVAKAQGRISLWERRPDDKDFLHVRLGTGMQPLTTQIEYPVRHFELEPDELTEKMYELVESPHVVQDIPIVLSLMDTTVCGISGQREQIIDFIRQLILQIAVFHSYDEVKTVFLLDKDSLAQLEEIRYLPHAWDDMRTIRFVATNEAEAYTVGEYIKEQVLDAEDKEKDLRKILRKRPYYLIFALEKKLLESYEGFKEILQADENLGVTVVSAHEDLPKEVQKLITLGSREKNVCTAMSADGGEDVFFAADDIDQWSVADVMSLLANTRLKTASQTQELPKMITFLEMFGAGRIEQLNPLKRWKENNPVKSLAAPVGVGGDGSLFMLDLHEKRQGPHGLVAGMTGSGKSEFIITYILSMAINYHPDEVAFVLIDYKGGGLAGAFENPQTGVKLPHLVGTITNLDGASIQRSLMSIESELIRRQKILNEVKSIVNEGTMDIYAYQKLYRAGKVSEPLPHLFIISDEFAELKQQQPEFMDKLISAARIGRSLGVHLILATQKPSGVVNDQIRSNTKFRVCLRVQDRSDSMDMLKRPEAAELTDTGRFYLQVGYNEYFALGQSAWCGAQYEPQDTVTVRREDTVEFLDITGQSVAKVKPKAKKTDSGMKQIVAIVKYLSDLADAHNIKPRQLWQPELPKLLDLDMFSREILEEEKNPMVVCLGLLDDPENQKQFPLTIDLKTCQNMLVVGDSGSGKTTVVQSVLYSLSKQLGPQEFHFYILDYSSRMLKLFKPLPHCGVVLQEEDSDQLDEFFKMINDIAAERKRLFSELEVDSFEAALAKKKIPLILVVIDNYVGLSSSKKGEAHVFQMPNYLKDTANYGIKYLITASHVNETASRVRQELGTRLCLHMKDKYDYGEILGCKVNYIPPEGHGRGLGKCEGRPLEFQSAAIFADANDAERTRYLKDAINELSSKCRMPADVRCLPVYSETATYEDFCRQFKRGRIPLGYSKQSGKPVAMPLKQFSALSVYFGNPEGVKPITENLLYAAKCERMDVWVVKRREGSIFETCEGQMPLLGENDGQIFSLDSVSLGAFRTLLLEEITTRNNLIQTYCEENQIDVKATEVYRKTFDYLRENTTPILLLIESFSDFCVSADMLSALLFDKAFAIAKRRNIYVVGCFEPEDYQQISSRTLYHGFNPDGNVVLFGGQLDKQKIYPMDNLSGGTEILQFNMGLMNYQKQLYPLLMPCGEIKTDNVDEDEKSIF